MTRCGTACAALAALALAGCGGSHAAAQKPCVDARARLGADVRRIRAAADRPVTDRLKGNLAVSRATDRFLHDLAVSPLDLVEQNRLIDHAMAALLGSCEQCFQALEAARPIPAIKSAGRGAGCGAP